MQRRALGINGPEVSAVGLGCASLSGIYGPTESDEAAIAVVHRALELGVNFFDTADVYGWPIPENCGHNELLLGRALKGRRDEAVIASKVGVGHGAFGKVWGQVCGEPAYIRACAEASLQRLGVDRIDIYYLHRVDPDVAIEESIGAMAELVAEGKVGHLGLSEASVASVRRAAAVHSIAALENEYSLWWRSEPEQDILPVTRELGIGFVAFCPLGRGMLTGAVTGTADVSDPNRVRHPRFSATNIDQNLAMLPPLFELARDKGCALGQVALAWLLAQGDDIVVIPGTKRVERMDENAGGGAVRLGAADIALLDEAFPYGAGVGDRYPQGMQEQLNR